jgi:hypothetical protein
MESDQLNEEDMWRVPKKGSSHVVASQLKTHFDAELERRGPDAHVLMRALLRVRLPEFLFCFAMKAVLESLDFIRAILLGTLIG